MLSFFLLSSDFSIKFAGISGTVWPSQQTLADPRQGCLSVPSICLYPPHASHFFASSQSVSQAIFLTSIHLINVLFLRKCQLSDIMSPDELEAKFNSINLYFNSTGLTVPSGAPALPFHGFLQVFLFPIKPTLNLFSFYFILPSESFVQTPKMRRGPMVLWPFRLFDCSLTAIRPFAVSVFARRG